MIHCIFSYLYIYIYISIWYMQIYNKQYTHILDYLYFCLTNCRSGAVEVRSPGGGSAADEGRIGSRAAGSPAGHGEGVDPFCPLSNRMKTGITMLQKISKHFQNPVWNTGFSVTCEAKAAVDCLDKADAECDADTKSLPAFIKLLNC